MHFFDLRNIAFQIWEYPISYVELLGTVFGLASVYFASKANIMTWGTGVINEIFLFILFYQVQLYADMFLQVYFFIVTIYGWHNWKANAEEKMISGLKMTKKLQLTAVVIFFSLLCGFVFSNIHLYLPEYFEVKASYPFIDSFVMISSIVATVLLAKKKIDNWYLWIAIDLVCVFLYFRKGVYFLSIEYFIFLGLASYGLYNWKKQLIHD